MAIIEESIIIKAPAEYVFDVVTDFEHYPDFQTDIEAVKVQKQTKTHALVSFTANIVQVLNYTLEFKLERPRTVSWKMVDGSSVIKANEGSWTVEKLDEKKTKLHFSSEIKFAFWVPSSITDPIIRTHVPVVLKDMKKRAEKPLKRALKKS